MACDASPHLTVAGEVGTGDAAIDAVRSLRPSVMVLDLALPDLEGDDLVRRTRKVRPDIRVLVLVNRTDDPTVFAVMKAGADGCLAKTASVEALREAVEMVAAGRRVFTPQQEQAAIVELGRMARHAREASALSASVTARELQILSYVSEGFTIRQVASRLGLSPRTVDTHIAKIYRKLGVTNRVRAIGRATELGLIDLSR
jgi:DNA-binding NarL/FixJ family response regulator